MIESESITLYCNKGKWLGQIVITSDGMISGVTEWGNLSFAWRSFGEKTLDNFKDFLLRIDCGYFSTKMFQGISYICHTEKVSSACDRYAMHILPALQKYLKENKQ
jgi:hypothetical protein